MALDPVIAGGFRGLQLQDPLEQYARVSQIQQAQQQNQLAALKMQEYQREVEQQNRLRSLNPSAPSYISDVMQIDPKLGSELQLRQSQRAAATRAEAASAAEARAKNLTYWQGLARDAAPTPTDDVLKSLAAKSVELQVADEPTASSQLQQILALPLEQRSQVLSRFGAAAAAPPAAPATPADVASMKALGFPLTPQGYEQFRAAQRQERMLSPEEEAQRVRIALASRPPPQPRPEAAPRTQQVTMSDGTLGIMNMDTGQVTPASLGGAPVKGKPSPFAEKTAVQRKQLGLDLDRAITELTDATKKGGLIDQSTGSGAGRLIDIGAGFIGQATPGAIAAGKLAPIADMVLKMVPRFEGPQSDKDTRSYKEAAGQLADSSLPNAIRKQAGLEIVRLMKERKNQFVTPEMATEGAGAGGATPAAAGGGNFPAPPAAAIDALRRGQGTDAQFDAIFGPGAAARARGR